MKFSVHPVIIMPKATSSMRINKVFYFSQYCFILLTYDEFMYYAKNKDKE